MLLLLVLLWRWMRLLLLLLMVLGRRVLRLLVQRIGRLDEMRRWLGMVGPVRRVRWLLLLRRQVLLLLMTERRRLVHEAVLGRERRLVQLRIRVLLLMVLRLVRLRKLLRVMRMRLL
jgi:hypothetical protein